MTDLDTLRRALRASPEPDPAFDPAFDTSAIVAIACYAIRPRLSRFGRAFAADQHAQAGEQQKMQEFLVEGRDVRLVRHI